MTDKIGTSITEFIRRQDIEVFRAAARRFRVHILVRRTNPASLKYIGHKGYAPKPIDCKPKTADYDAVLKSGLIVRCAGLVVNPTLPGFEKVFKSTDKRNDAVRHWTDFELAHGLGRDRLSSGRAYVEGSSTRKGDGVYHFTTNRGGVYLVQDDPKHKHYGCLYFCPLALGGEFPRDVNAALAMLSKRSTNAYLHGDYDLYGVVPAEMPDLKTVEQARKFGARNLYTPESRRLADFINRHIGVAMIQHGAQENEPKDHADDHLDVFWANGDVTEARGRAEIEKLYRVEFRGRGTGPSSSSGLIRR